jgi:hypothetical protein
VAVRRRGGEGRGTQDERKMMEGGKEEVDLP